MDETADERHQRIAQALMYADGPMQQPSWWQQYGHMLSPGGLLQEGAFRAGLGQTAQGYDQLRNAGGALDGAMTVFGVNGLLRALAPTMNPGQLADKYVANSLMTGPRDAEWTSRMQHDVSKRAWQSRGPEGQKAHYWTDKTYAGGRWPWSSERQMGPAYTDPQADEFIRQTWNGPANDKARLSPTQMRSLWRTVED